ncbi:winged helix-turn-helix domain-containing protein [Actinophytocola gossypii]|uniref:Helix-turn-helix transcriptional regulator n=1 Tax=Actinophytocola gossypii TaxID=2812003 RepID=A0ABT2JGG8_9PSEU|nr:helix-turn-helix domain-containing protein [Actinophytocola gossypii]MCT2586973.1 helix-turn-helix transcriptional regulator [Actinophytocola gossypii]
MADHLQLDSRAVRVLAHPLRARLLSELRVNGAATATTLAARLDTNTGATSYHLRKLAEVNMVEETGEGTGKQRFWAAAQRSHGWQDTDVENDPDALAAAGWLRAHYWAYMSEKVARWEDARDRWPVAWRDAAGMSDMLLELSVPQLRAMTDEINEVVLRHQNAALADPDETARRITFLYYALPTDPEDAP